MKYRVTATRKTYYYFSFEADTLEEMREKHDAIFLADDFEADYEPDNRTDWDTEIVNEAGEIVE